MATVEKLENNKMKLTIEVGAEKFDEALQKAYIKTRSKYIIDGFRKGKAPRKRIEDIYGESVFMEDAFELVHADAYQDAIKEHGLDPVERPDMNIEKIGKGEGVVFTAEFAVKPEVLLGSYKGIEVTLRAYTVEDAQIDAQIEQEREKVARYVEVERPIQNGDRVMLDYAGSIDDVPFEGGAAEDYPLVIGSNAFIPGFEEQLIGLHKNEQKDIFVTFPEEYHAAELKGKAAKFAVAIKGVQVKELPDLDDEFAQDVSDFDTLDALREDKRAALEKQNADRAKAQMEDEAIRKVVESAAFDVPEAMIERQMDYMVQDVAYRLSMSGINLEAYCQYMGVSAQTMREGYRKEAEERVRTQLVLEAVAKAENIAAEEADVEKELAVYAEQAGKGLDEFKKTLGEDDLSYFKERIRVQKTIDFLMDNAVLIEKPAEENKEEKPKKAKKAKADGETAEDAETEKKKAPVKRKGAESEGVTESKAGGETKEEEAPPIKAAEKKKAAADSGKEPKAKKAEAVQEEA